MSEMACLVTFTDGSSNLKKSSSNLQLNMEEPCTWSVTLDNSEGDYNPGESIANPRTYTGVFNLVYEAWDGSSSRTSPDLILEDYDYDTHTVTLSGRCKLAKLDREDQVFGDFKEVTVAAICTALAAPYGLTVAGAPSRTVKLFRGFGNPLNLLRTLLYPTHTFRMGAGSEIVVEPVATHTGGPTITDEDWLEVLKFKRTSEIFNKATVERVEGGGGQQTLADEERSASAGENIYDSQRVDLSSPSRSFSIDVDFGQRGELTNFVVWEEEGSAIGPLEGTKTYLGTTDATYITFDYILSDWAYDPDRGPFTPTWQVVISGTPAEGVAPSEDFSATASAGAGDRPYPEPFTSLALETYADALAAAQALVHVGTRRGNPLEAAWRLSPDKIGWPNQEFALTDYLSGLTDGWIAETLNVTEEEAGDTGTITMEASRAEET